MRIVWSALAIFVMAIGQAGTPGVARLAGIDSGSGIAFALLSVEGRVMAPTQPATPPRLTAQCTRDATGKMHFELLVDEGNAPDLHYAAPWKPSKDAMFPPPLRSLTVTMEYVGYVKEKPVKRQWDQVDGLPGEWKYATPGLNSHNMEDVTRCLQYLRSLPRLRLSLPGRPVLEFETAAWQAQLKLEPICGGSSL